MNSPDPRIVRIRDSPDPRACFQEEANVLQIELHLLNKVYNVKGRRKILFKGTVHEFFQNFILNSAESADMYYMFLMYDNVLLREAAKKGPLGLSGQKND